MTKRKITIQNYFFTKKRINENKNLNTSLNNLDKAFEDCLIDNPGTNFNITSSTDNYSDSESNTIDINGLTNESKPNTEINITNVFKMYPKPTNIFQNMNNGPIQKNLTFYPKSKYCDCWNNFSKKWFKTFPWLEYSVSEDVV